MLNMAPDVMDVVHSLPFPLKVIKLKVSPGTHVSIGTVLFTYTKNVEGNDDGKVVTLNFRSRTVGTVHEVLKPAGSIVNRGEVFVQLTSCKHPTVMKDLCAECGTDLRLDEEHLPAKNTQASVSMIHSVPELKVSEEQAIQIGKDDEIRLQKANKLVLLVDLDQTLIHTTNDNIPNNIKDVYHFKLYGPNSPWYHTRLRPGTMSFLENVSKLFELHICTFGVRAYAHMIANILDPDGKYFSHRILSRDECFNPASKTGNLKALFPCGDSMVCIIDDREDVWNYSPNLIPVKPYHFFQHTGDINAPPGLDKTDQDSDDDEDCLLSRVIKKALNRHKTESLQTGTQSSANEAPDPEITPKVSTSEDTVDSVLKSEKTEESKDEEVEEKIPEVQREEVDKEVEKDDNDGRKSDLKYEYNAESSLPVNDSLSQDKVDDGMMDVEDNDDYLLYLEDILNVVHKAYYKMFAQTKLQMKPDLKNVIPYVRLKVLKSVNIVFSGIIPTNMNIERTKAYNVAKSLGAVIQNKLVTPATASAPSKITTHLIAAHPGTAKVNEAKKIKGIHVVNIDWLWNCSERWEHVDERLFPLKMGHSRNSPVMAKSLFSEASKKTGDRKGNSQKDDFASSYNPLLAFSSDDIADMDKEVEDIFNEESDEDSGDNKPSGVGNVNQYSSSEDSLSNDQPRGTKRKRQELRKDVSPPLSEGESNVSKTSESEDESVKKYPKIDDPQSDQSNASNCSVDEDFAAIIERELLENL